jgi:hypothetical protein
MSALVEVRGATASSTPPFPLVAVLVFLDPLLPLPFALTAILMTLVVVILVIRPPLQARSKGRP